MQGWRHTMEDSHFAKCDLPNGEHIFAVFDGHGGFNISKYVGEQYVNTFINTEEYKKKDYHNAFKKTNYSLDEQMAKKTNEVDYLDGKKRT